MLKTSIIIRSSEMLAPKIIRASNDKIGGNNGNRSNLGSLDRKQTN